MSYLPIERILEIRNQAAEALRSAEWALNEAMLREKLELTKELIGLHPSADSHGENSEGRPVVWFFGGKLSVNIKVSKSTFVSSSNIAANVEYEVYEFDSGKDISRVDTLEEVREELNNFQKEK